MRRQLWLRERLRGFTESSTLSCIDSLSVIKLMFECLLLLFHVESSFKSVLRLVDSAQSLFESIALFFDQCLLCPRDSFVRGVSWSEVATVPKRKSHRGLDLNLSWNSEEDIWKGRKESNGTK